MPQQQILDSHVHYEDVGSGVPYVFLHGNPASSYLWRNVIRGLDSGRRLAPDLIGMGRSGKPDIAYSFVDHARYLDEWFDALELETVVLVGHDWGGALAFDWAARHPQRVGGIVFLESIVKPMEWGDLTPPARQRFQDMRTPGVGEEMVLNENRFVTSAYTGGVLNPVSDKDMAVYLDPYDTPESRRPILAWARQMPLGGEPAELVARIDYYDDWLANSFDVPKLLLTFDGSPTLLIDAELTEWCRRNIASLEVVACGAAGHHAPEDRPDEIASAISAWTGRHPL